MARKILAIDDSPTLRQFIVRGLSNHLVDYDVTVAKDGAEGLALARTQTPELILLDYILPDFNGDEVCRQLLQFSETRALPVILMSSNTADIRRVQGEYGNVKRALNKPFTPELLCATVSHVLREHQVKQNGHSHKVAAPEVAPMEGEASLILAGNTGSFPLFSVMNHLAEDRLTGVLKIFHPGGKTLEAYVIQGQVGLVTSLDVEWYLKGDAPVFSREQMRELDSASQIQSELGCPVFLTFSERGIMERSRAVALCQHFGFALFALNWTSGRLRFAFYALEEVPEYVRTLPSFTGNMDEFILETLRRVGDECESSLAWGEPTGIPGFTREGYDRIQQLPLTQEEWEFASLVAENLSLSEIAERNRMSIERAQQVLFRFWNLGILDYWPAAAFRGD